MNSFGLMAGTTGDEFEVAFDASQKNATIVHVANPFADNLFLLFKFFCAVIKKLATSTDSYLNHTLTILLFLLER